MALASYWYGVGAILVWCLYCISVVTAWHWRRIDMALVFMVLVWYGRGIDMASEWYRYGIGMVLVW